MSRIGRANVALPGVAGPHYVAAVASNHPVWNAGIHKMADKSVSALPEGYYGLDAGCSISTVAFGVGDSRTSVSASWDPSAAVSGGD